MSAIEIAAGLGVLAGAALQAAIGFGFALVAAPLLFAATTAERAVGLLLALALAVNLLTLATEGRRPRPLGVEVVRLVLASVPGAFVGVAVLRAADEALLQILVTTGVFASLAVQHVVARRAAGARRRAASWHAPLAGFVSGALNTSTTTGGPPVVLHLLGRGLEPEQVRDTLVAYFIAASLAAAAVLAATGTSGAAPPAAALAALVPVVIAGHLAGRAAFGRLAQGRYEPALIAALTISAAAGLLTTLL